MLHIDRQMSRTLRRIDQRQRAHRARLPAKLGHGIDRAERIGNVCEREKFHFRRQRLLELFERESAVVTHRDEAKARVDSFGQELPRHEVAVVLHLGEQNHISGAKKFPAPGCATRLMLSVVPRVNTISSALAAPK